jgi:hypothetical protein
VRWLKKHPVLRLAIGPVLSASFAGSMWLVTLGVPNRPAVRFPDVGPADGLGSWPGTAGSSEDPAGLVVGEFQVDPTSDTEALAQLADRGVWAYGLAARGDARFTELAAGLADLHYIRDARRWCDQQYGAQIDSCTFNIDFVACRQGDTKLAKIVYARALINWSEHPDQHEDCSAHVACIARGRVGSHVPMPEIGTDPNRNPTLDELGECIGVAEALSHANFPSPLWYEDRAVLHSTIAHWENTLNDPWGRFDPEDPVDRLEMIKAQNTLDYLELTLEERFGR